MRKLDNPSFGINDILDALKTNKLNDLGFLENMTSSKEDNYEEIKKLLINDETRYKKEYDELIHFKASIELPGIAEKISGQYKHYSNKTLNEYRKQIYKLAKGRCPICDTIFAYSQINLDHILPKSKYKALAITPINLVPTCNFCNAKKGVGNGTKVFSPYFHEYDLTKLLAAKLIIEEGDCSSIQVEIYVKPLNDIKEIKISSADELREIESNIELYGLFAKYSAIANIFINETMEYFRNISLLYSKHYFHSKRQIRDLLTEQDVWVDKRSILGKTYYSETFIRHISIEAMKSSEIFLNILTKKINGNRDINQLILEQIQGATLSLTKRSEAINVLNCNALIKQVLRGSDLVAYYRVEHISDDKIECRLLDFQGAYQNTRDIIKFEASGEWNQFNLAIVNQKIQIDSNTQTLEKFTFCKNNVGVELFVPIMNCHENCIGVVYIGMEGELDMTSNFDTSYIREFHNQLNKIYSQYEST